MLEPEEISSCTVGLGSHLTTKGQHEHNIYEGTPFIDTANQKRIKWSIPSQGGSNEMPKSRIYMGHSNTIVSLTSAISSRYGIFTDI